MAKREELIHYIDTSMGQEEAVYALIGDGVSSMTEEFNVEEETTQWINQANGNTEVRSYTPSIEVEKQDCIDDDMQALIDKIIDELPTGTDAETYYVRFRLKDAIPSASGKYVAYRRRCAVSATSTGGDAGANVVNSIKIGGKGSAVKGYFDVATKEFTEGEYSAGVGG